MDTEECRGLQRPGTLAALPLTRRAYLLQALSRSVIHSSESPHMTTTRPPESVDAERYRDAMRRVPTAVTIVTSLFEDEANGLTATAVCSVSADPPQVLICVNREATAHSLIVRSRGFVVNFLSEEHEERARRFSRAKLAPQ